MRKTYVVIAGLGFSTLFYLGLSAFPTFVKTEEERINELYESSFYQEAEGKFGVNVIAVSQNEKAFDVQLDKQEATLENIEKTQSFFEDRLISEGIKGYTVEVYAEPD